jgi:serine/threonine protein kinase
MLASDTRILRDDSSTVTLDVRKKAEIISAENAQSVVGDKFRIENLLGRGRFGVVYKASDKYLRMHFAIKFLTTFGPPEKRSFKAEVKAGLTLAHPNIVKVIGYDVHELGAYIIMEFVDGGTLDTLRSSRKDNVVTEEWIRNIALDVCKGLTHAHNRGVIHQDIKPSNILVDRHGTAKIADFGVASIESEHGRQIAGTPAYMAPEQLRGDEVDARTDIYSLGVVLYECLTNRNFRYIGSMSAGMNSIIHRCLAPDPDTRWANASELGAELSRIETSNPADSTQRHGGLIMGTLIIEGPGIEGEQVPITNLQNEIVLGKDNLKCDVLLNDLSVDRLHAIVRRDRDRFDIQDLSKGGTFLNGQLVEGSHVLVHEDEIRIGPYKLIFKSL